MVFTRSDNPSNAKYSHCMGIITPWAVANPFKVNKDSVGGQSIKMKSYSDRIGANADFSRRSRSGSPTKSISAPDKCRFAHKTSYPPEADVCRETGKAHV